MTSNLNSNVVPPIKIPIYKPAMGSLIVSLSFRDFAPENVVVCGTAESWMSELGF